jgi:hypothetical protein
MSSKKERTNFVYGHRSRGTIKCGHLHMGSEGELKSDVQSGVMLQAFDSRHYMTMDIDGVRKGWTLNRCPGVYSIRCATDVTPGELGYVLLCEQGDISISAPNGRIRLFAQDIDLRADGPDNQRGSINLDSSQSVNIDTQVVDVKGDAGIRIFTPYTLDLIGNQTIHFTANFIRGLSAASCTQSSKTNLSTSKSFQTKSLYT